MNHRTPRPPNVLFLLSDDQGAWAMGCAGNNEVRTPNLDRLARTGTRFENFFCASPVCSPARASILTGMIPSRHGVHDWLSRGNSTAERDGVLIEYLRGRRGYTDLLAENGYVCGISGKWHLGDAHHAQKGFAFWAVHAKGGGPYYGAPMIRNGDVYREPRYVTDVITDNALRFLEERAAGGAPFYLSVHYTAPHSPWTREHHPPPLYDDYFRNCAFRSLPQRPVHPWQVAGLYVESDERRREWLSGYFAAIEAMDANIGRLLDLLEARGLREETLVVFMSDNGMNMGHHGIYGKGNGTFPMNMYDTSVKAPMLVSRPGSVPQGAVERGLWSQYDIMPTLLDYAGLANPDAEWLPGRSFAPVLRGEAAEAREDVVVFDEYGPVRMVRDREWKYVHRYPYGPNELYHLIEDPDEERNLVAEPGLGRRIAEMKSRLDRWFDRYADPRLDGARLPVTGRGQVDLAGLEAEGRNPFGADWLCAPPELAAEVIKRRQADTG